MEINDIKTEIKKNDNDDANFDEVVILADNEHDFNNNLLTKSERDESFSTLKSETYISDEDEIIEYDDVNEQHRLMIDRRNKFFLSLGLTILGIICFSIGLNIAINTPHKTFIPLLTIGILCIIPGSHQLYISLRRYMLYKRIWS